MRSISLLAVVFSLLAGPLAASPHQANENPIYEPGNGVTPPVVVKDARPEYTAEAKKARIQGVVELKCVVETDGSVGDVKVIKSLDAGLDQEAVKAARKWTFEPGKKDGKAVRVRIALEMTFTLK
jgi:periplasmic protein TonB